MQTPLFFSPSDLPRIRKNAESPLLRDLFRQFQENAASTIRESFDEVEASGDLIHAWGHVLRELKHLALVHLLQPTPQRETLLLETIRRMIALPHWDYFLNNRDQRLSIQRGSMATKAFLFAREVLGDAFPSALVEDYNQSLIEKGILPAYHAVRDMDHWKEDPGWRADEQHEYYYSVSMDRFPLFFGSNNLRADPTSALGIGAIAISDLEDRSSEWLDLAIESTRKVLAFFGKDGTYYEGISYANYTLQTTLSFLDVYRRAGGNLEPLVDKDQLAGFIDTLLAMHLGRNDDGSPDVANFGDAKGGVNPGLASWIGQVTGHPASDFAAQTACLPAGFFDFLHTDPEANPIPPSDELKNRRDELGWIFSKPGWADNDAYLAFRGGGPYNHEHADKNTFIYKFNGERLLTDPLGAAYDWRKEGWLLRQTAAHNGVLINGKGQRYVDGREGTSQSNDFAVTVQYRDHGDTLWFISDATPAYQFENYSLRRVLRTVLFAKPDFLLILDQVHFHYVAQPIALRFLPDNRDGKAEIHINGSTFRFSRPKAGLHGSVFFRSAKGSLQSGRLDLPADEGVFPFLEVQSPEKLRHEVLTVLQATPAGQSPNPPEVDPTHTGWTISAKGKTYTLTTAGRLEPDIQF